MDMLKSGYVKLYREFIKLPLFVNEKTWKVWTWCMMKAAYKETEVHVKSQTIPLLPGQFIMGRTQASRELNMSIQSIRTALKQLKASGDIEIEVTNKFSVITVVDWGIQQSDNNEANQQNDSPCLTSKLTSKSTVKSTVKLTSKSTSKNNPETPDMSEFDDAEDDGANSQINQQINQQINSQTNTLTNHKQEVKEFKELKEFKIHNDLIATIEHWNNQPCMIKCKEPTAKLNTVFSRLYKIYGLEEILATITRYSIVIDDKQYFFNTRWNMETFLRQGNAFPDFTCDGQKWINYTEKTAKQDESHEKVDIWM